MSSDHPQTQPIRPNSHPYQRYIAATRRERSSSPPRRPWLLAAMALVCGTLVIVGSFGPWMYFERVSETAPDSWTISGTSTDGIFGILFAGVAIVALLISLFKTDAEDVAWIAIGAFVFCAGIGLFDWFIAAPSERSLEPGQRSTIVQIAWGIKLVSLAGTAGAVITFFASRQLHRY